MLLADGTEAKVGLVVTKTGQALREEWVDYLSKGVIRELRHKNCMVVFDECLPNRHNISSGCRYLCGYDRLCAAIQPIFDEDSFFSMIGGE